MGLFFIDTATGQVATQHQLVAAGVAPADGNPPRPWYRIQGTGDATTLWYAVMRRQEKGIFIGTLVFRHTPHHSLLLERGWEEIPHTEIRAPQREDVTTPEVAAPAMPEVDSPSAETVLDGVPSAGEIVAKAKTADEILDEQPSADAILGRDAPELRDA